MTIDRDGHEPDPRFTLANERTYLAWMRTSLTLIAGGVVFAELGDQVGSASIRRILSLGLILTGVTCTTLAFRHWRRVQRALRAGTPIPSPAFAPVLTALVVLAGLALVVLLLIDD